jgi:uncharacterized protein (TIGR02172 family)
MLGKKIGEGAMSEVFLYNTYKVVKLYRTDNGCADLEFNNCVVAWSLGIITPKPYERITIGNRPGIVYEFIDGKDLTENLLKSPAQQACRMAKSLFEFGQLIPAESACMEKLQTLETVLRYSLRKNILLTQREKDEILSYFLTLPHSNCLYHGDFNPTNLIQAKDQLYIIDLVSLSIGNPLADVMQMILLYKYKVIPDRFPENIKAAYYGCRQVVLTNFIEEYMHLSGCSDAQLQSFFIPVAAMQLAVGGIDDQEAGMILRDLRLEMQRPSSIDIKKCSEPCT